MKSQFSKRCSWDTMLDSVTNRKLSIVTLNQKGQAVIFASFFIIILMVLGGVGVDTAHVFLKKFQVQRALDASAMAGISRYESGESDPETIEQAAVQMANYNFQQMGLADVETTSVSAQLTIDENNVATLVLNASVIVPTFFMRLIPAANLDTVTINAKASSRRIPAVISLILDTSGSMSGNMQALKDAANAFVDSFENDLDKIAIVSFGYKATLRQAMAPVDKDALHGIVNSLTANGWTNMSEAMAMGRKEIEQADDPNAENDPIKAIVLFSDGAPNTMRGIFTNAKPLELDKNYPSSNPQYWDYIVYTAASPRTARHPITLTNECTTLTNCFYSYAYLDSREVLRPNSGSVSLSSGSTQTIRETYRLAIVETDYAKTDGATVYTIGLGVPANEGFDPYQNLNEHEKLKSYLLRRLANDPSVSGDPAFPTLPNNSDHPIGAYFQTPDPNELVELFETVARRIKIRLIE